MSNSGCATAQILGRMTRDPILTSSADGLAICRFGMATNYKDKASFFDVTAFGKQADLIGGHIKKGDMVYVSCRMELNSWESADGKKKDKLCFIANDFAFVGSKAEAEHPARTGVVSKPQHVDIAFDEDKGSVGRPPELTDAEIPF